MAPTYRITTLGCRVNHAETRELATVLESRGLRPADGGDAAAVEVVHTCTVTGTAAAKSRQAIRRARRRAAEGTVFVTGCWTATDPARAVELAGDADRVVGHAPAAGGTMIDGFARAVDRWLHGTAGAPARPRPRGGSASVLPLPVVPAPTRAARHVRAELKIQDGCDARCTFCIIPHTRPALRSKRLGDAVAEARRLVDLGHPEIVLTGVFIGAYGHETALRRRQADPGAEPLADLVDAVAQVPGLARLRVSSMEPGDVTPALLDAMTANADVVVPHLHLPLQSGSDAVLRRMNRQYRVGDYLAMIDRVHAALARPGLPPAITTDVICGFPGETDADFEATVDVVRRVGFLHLHVFPFAPRAGTAAARWRDRFVPVPVARRRVRRLIDMETDPADGLSVRFHRRLVGRDVRLIVEGPDPDDDGGSIGRCDHYAVVRIPIRRPRGTLLRASIVGADPRTLVGRPAPSAVRLPVLNAR